METVSYTHLDVYKRQPTSRVLGISVSLAHSQRASSVAECAHRNSQYVKHLRYEHCGPSSRVLGISVSLAHSQRASSVAECAHRNSCLLYTSRCV